MPASAGLLTTYSVTRGVSAWLLTVVRPCAPAGVAPNAIVNTITAAPSAARTFDMPPPSRYCAV